MKHWFSFFLIFAISVATLWADDEPDYSPGERKHWSFLPIARPVPPVADDSSSLSKSPIDAFILRKLRKANLAVTREADRPVIVRRLFFQVTGLPPSPSDVYEFVNDTSPDAYERLVDRLLASPHHGEHWAQHWLDVIRFAETEGFEYDRHRAGAWRFRDYVIRSLNDDKPFDQFVREQLAGDEMNSSDRSVRRDQRIAAGFHRLGAIRRNAGNAEVAFSRNEVLTEMTDIIGVSFLGMTIGCARCHDHMFDPILQRDYYQFQAHLAATHEQDVVLASQREKDAWQKQTDNVNKQVALLKKRLKAADAETEEKLLTELRLAQQQLPAPLATVSTVANVEKDRTPIHVLGRGDVGNKGKRVGPRVLGVLLPDDSKELAPNVEGPKSILANWITSANNPLTARVTANRMWLYHFGRGIVGTANDFGTNGDPPSHPDLLDWLASDLIRNDWSWKSIHRQVLLTAAYRRSSTIDSKSKASDPDNRLLARFSRRRLAAQEIRDSLLEVAGVLTREAGGPSVMVPVDPELVDLLYKPTQWQVSQRRSDHYRRSVYLVAKRNLRLPFMEVFDQPDLQCSCFNRESSTHAPQALELLNGKLSNQLSEAFAARLLSEANGDPERQIKLAFLHATARLPSPQQESIAHHFLTEQPLREFALAVFNLNRFLYVD